MRKCRFRGIAYEDVDPATLKTVLNGDSATDVPLPVRRESRVSTLTNNLSGKRYVRLPFVFWNICIRVKKILINRRVTLTYIKFDLDSEGGEGGKPTCDAYFRDGARKQNPSYERRASENQLIGAPPTMCLWVTSRALFREYFLSNARHSLTWLHDEIRP